MRYAIRTAFLTLLLFVGLDGALGCTGGQTGDSGNADGPPLCETEREELLSIAQAEAEGLQARTSGCGDGPVDITFAAPPQLWAREGRRAPSDRTVTAQVVIEVPHQIRVRRVRATELGLSRVQDCADEVDALMNVRISIPELGVELSGTGEAPLAARPSDAGPDASASSCPRRANIESLGDCSMGPPLVLPGSPASASTIIMSCGAGVFSTTTCSDEDTVARAGADPLSGLNAAELLERALKVFPMPLSCRGERAPRTLGLSVAQVPADVCSSMNGPYWPITVSASLPALGYDGQRAATLRLETMSSDCEGRNRPGAGGEPAPCSLLTLKLSDDDTRLWLEVQVDGPDEMRVAVDVFGDRVKCTGAAAFR